MPIPGAKIASALIEMSMGNWFVSKNIWEYLARQTAICALCNALAKGHFLPLWINTVLRLPPMGGRRTVSVQRIKRGLIAQSPIHRVMVAASLTND